MIALIVASKGFRDEEYFIPLQVFSDFGMEVTTFSDKKGLVIGDEGGEAEAEKTLQDFNVDNFSAIVFVGGSGCLKHLDNSESYRIIIESIKKNCLVCAICIAPIILAKSGILKGLKATVWSSSMNKSGVDILTDNGAIYESSSVIKSSGVITASGPKAAKEFAMAVVSSIKTK